MGIDRAFESELLGVVDSRHRTVTRCEQSLIKEIVRMMEIHKGLAQLSEFIGPAFFALMIGAIAGMALIVWRSA